MGKSEIHVFVASGLGGVNIHQKPESLALELNTHKPVSGVREIEGGSSGRKSSRCSATANSCQLSPQISDNGCELLNSCSFTSRNILLTHPNQRQIRMGILEMQFDLTKRTHHRVTKMSQSKCFSSGDFHYASSLKQGFLIDFQMVLIMIGDGRGSCIHLV